MENIREQLLALQTQIGEKKKDIQLDLIEKHLVRYRDFIGHLRDRLGYVETLEDFRQFRNEWKETGGIRNLPKELAFFHQYQSLVEQYNALLLPALFQGEIDGKEFAPLTISEQEMDIFQMEGCLYERPFRWERIKERLTGPAVKNAVYIHAVSVLEANDILDMVSDGAIKKETILALPFAVTERGVITKDGQERECFLKQAYHNHLTKIYDSFGLFLPPTIYMESPLKGVTFDGRTEKLLYILHQMKERNLKNRDLVLKLEPYTFTPQNGEPEPAIRVLATLPQDKQCRNVDIGNIDRSMAIQIAKEHPEATLLCSIKELDTCEIAGTNGTVRQPYAKLLVEIADKPREQEKTAEKNLSEVMDDLLQMEELT